MKSFLSFAKTLFLQEKLIQYNNGQKYGQIVFLAGGSGSGKGFARTSFIDAGSFKVLDVDSFKDAFVKIHDLFGKYPEIGNLKLSDPNDLNTLHQFIKKTGVAKKQFELLFGENPSGVLKNIMFDETGKDHDTYKVVPQLLEMGYKPQNIHITWILTNYAEAVQNNIQRGSKPGGRRVADEVLLGAHKGAAKTMYEVIAKNQLAKGIDGSITVILNNRKETKSYQDNNGDYVVTSGKGFKDFISKAAPLSINAVDLSKLSSSERSAREKQMELSAKADAEAQQPSRIVKDFSYITLKKPGKPIMTQGDVFKKLEDWIRGNAPDVSFMA